MSTARKDGAHFAFGRMLMRINENPPEVRGIFYNQYFDYLFLIAACAAASLAIGTRKGEQET